MSTETVAPLAPSLEALIGLSIRALIRRFHLNRDWIIGLVGDRGSGKSLGGANIALKDFMMNGEPCWSNMQMKLVVSVEDEVAANYGLSGGEVNYEAEPIDKQSFLALDSRYEGGCLFFDEFNLEYGEARRSSANVNLLTDRAVQQLRKLQCGLIYTVINEMYVDSRIRDNTDVFIKCSDTAMKKQNLAGQMQQGVVFEWLVYAMTPKLAGNEEIYTPPNMKKKPLGPYKMQLKHLWESIDTLERQAQGRTKYTDNKDLLPIKLAENPATRQIISEWAWMEKRMDEFYKNHAGDGDNIEIQSEDFRRELGVEENKWGYVLAQFIKPNLNDMERRGPRGSRGRYIIPNRVLV